MATPHLALDHVMANQANKETTINTQADGLDNAMNGVLELDMSSDVVLTDAQFTQNQLFILRGSPGATALLGIPAFTKSFALYNQCGQDVDIELASDTSGALTLSSGGGAIYHSDGTELFEVTSGSGGGSTSSFKSITADYELLNADLAGGVFLLVNSATDVQIYVSSGLTNTEPVTIIQVGEGQVTINEQSGVGIIAAGAELVTRTKGSAASLIPVGGDDYYAAGDLVRSGQTTGQNANGEWVRFPDGTQICTTLITTSAAGNVTWTYPIAFSSAPRITGTAQDNAPRVVSVSSIGTTTAAIGGWALNSTRIADDAMLLAVGRWYEA